MNVSMRAFLRTGMFGEIHLGMRHSEVFAILGEPDDWAGYDTARRRQPDEPEWYVSDAPSWEHAAIWKYGEIELHFWVIIEGVERLALIYRDDLWALFSDPLYGGRAIQ